MEGSLIKTKRLFSGIWSAADLSLAKKLWGDPQVTKYIDARGKLTKEHVQSRLNQEIICDKKYNVQYWPIFLNSNGEFIGCCGLRPYELKNNIYEIGFHICSSHWGGGFAMEAARGVMKYAFTQLNAKGLFAGHNPNNRASRKLLQKLGFYYTHDEYYEPTGLNHPSYLLTTDEYHHLP